MGCSPPKYPTSKFIQSNREKYKKPHKLKTQPSRSGSVWSTIFSLFLDHSYDPILHPVAKGGGSCDLSSKVDCGMNVLRGSCVSKLPSSFISVGNWFGQKVDDEHLEKENLRGVCECEDGWVGPLCKSQDIPDLNKEYVEFKSFPDFIRDVVKEWRESSLYDLFLLPFYDMDGLKNSAEFDYQDEYTINLIVSALFLSLIFGLSLLFLFGSLWRVVREIWYGKEINKLIGSYRVLVPGEPHTTYTSLSTLQDLSTQINQSSTSPHSPTSSSSSSLTGNRNPFYTPERSGNDDQNDSFGFPFPNNPQVSINDGGDGEDEGRKEDEKSSWSTWDQFTSSLFQSSSENRNNNGNSRDSLVDDGNHDQNGRNGYYPISHNYRSEDEGEEEEDDDDFTGRSPSPSPLNSNQPQTRQPSSPSAPINLSVWMVRNSRNKSII